MGKESDVVVYVVDGEIFFVGIVDRNCDIFYGYKIERGMVCVLIIYFIKFFVFVLFILGDFDENCYL